MPRPPLPLRPRPWPILAALALALPPGPSRADDPPRPPTPAAGPEGRLAERDRLAVLAKELRAAGRLDEAARIIEAKLEIERAVLGESSEDAIGSLAALAAVHAARDDWAASAATLRRAHRSRIAASGMGHWRTIDASWAIRRAEAVGGLDAGARRRFAEVGPLMEKFAASYPAGRLVEALRLARQVLELRREALGERHPSVAASRSNIASVLSGLGRHAEALEEHRRALGVRVAALGERHPAVADSRYGIAIVLGDLARHAEALEEHRRALEIKVAALGERHPAVAASRSNIAVALGELGRHAEALEEHRRALGVRVAALGERHPAVAASRSNIAVALVNLGRHAEALEEHRRALEIKVAALGERHPDVADSRNGIAYVLSGLGRQAEALEEFRRSLGVRVAALGERHPDVAASRSNIAYVLRDLGRHAEALEELDSAVAALATGDGPLVDRDPALLADGLRQIPDTVVSLLRRGVARGAGPDSLHATLVDYRAAALVLEGFRGREPGGGSGGDRDADTLRAGEGASELAPLTVGVAARLAEAEDDRAALGLALGAAESAAARVFLQGLGRSRGRALGRVDPALLAEEDRLAADLTRIDGQVDREQARTLEARDADAVFRLLAERKAAAAALAALADRMRRESPQYAALMFPRPCSVAEARACLADDEVALEFVLGAGASYLIVLTKGADSPGGGLSVHTLPPAADIADLVGALTLPGTLRDADAARERGAEAYRTLLTPAAAAIAGKGLVIVPSRSLGYLPFELLVEPDGDGPGRWLVERHRVRYAPSLTSLHFVGLWDRDRAAPERALWALGDPAYDTPSGPDGGGALVADAGRGIARAYRGEGGGDAAFAGLPGTRAEVEAIRSTAGAGPGDVLLGPEATEAAVKRLSESGELAKFRLVHFACHGILGRGDGMPPALVLAQAGNQGGEDGFLQLDEVTRLRLNADLVALSACQTGRGRLHNAEGVSGLARAFLYAGSRSVLCSLWQVADRETSALMADLYGGLKAGRSPSEALRAAQIRMIEAGEPPFYWAPFILMGK